MLEKMNVYIKKNGVAYMFPWVNAYILLGLKLVLGLLFLILAVIKMPVLALPSAVIAFFVPDILINISNNADNDSMLTDIESIYDIMRIQARAGVFIQDSLMDCYLPTKNARLKSALLEL